MQQMLIVLGILLVFGCADVSKENQLQTGCSEGSESTPANEYVSPSPTPSPTVTSWTKQLGTSSSDSGYGITSDSSGNIYVTGFTDGDLDGNTSAGSDDIFVVKYNSSGIKQWTQQLRTSSNDTGVGITSDSSDNVYITGFTRGDLDGNTNAGSNDLLDGYELNDLFVVKYNSSGIKQWTRQLGTSSSDSGNGITSDSRGNVYVSGTTEGGLDGNTNAGSSDIFVVKYNSSGVKQWTRQLGTSSSDTGYGITSDSSDNVYITGSTVGGLNGTTNAGSSDLIVVKYNSSGVKQWTRQLGTSSSDSGYGITSDSRGNVYVSGTTEGGLDGNTNAGLNDLIVVKYSSSGIKQWTRQLGTSSGDRGWRITSDSSGNVYVTGDTWGGLDGNTSAGSDDIFVVKYNSSGIKQWTQQLGTAEHDEGHDITIDSSGNLYATGYIGYGLDGNTYAGGRSDIFVVKYDTNGNKQ